MIRRGLTMGTCWIRSSSVRSLPGRCAPWMAAAARKRSPSSAWSRTSPSSARSVSVRRVRRTIAWVSRGDQRSALSPMVRHGSTAWVTFSERKDIPVWHPDVRVWEVNDAKGNHKASFYGDYFARPSKRSGAWMTSLRDQQKLDGDIAPSVINVCNFSKGTNGQPSSLSPDDARTSFHEFGHGSHGMSSNVMYPSSSGTSVFTDFVESPSQLYEHWQERPEVS
ncbi:hypothetical protein OY671_008826, partial [Metschnikowia pulcherrima]